MADTAETGRLSKVDYVNCLSIECHVYLTQQLLSTFSRSTRLIIDNHQEYFAAQGYLTMTS